MVWMFLLLLVLAPAGALAQPQKVILDTDGDADYDDVVALMTAAASPELQILGVVVTGSDAERRARAVAKALAIMGRDDLVVHLGEPPISRPPSFDYMAQFPPRRYGLKPELEKWPADFADHRPAQSGTDFYLEQMPRFPGEISVIVTGPLSTLGRSMQLAEDRGTGAAFRQAIGRVLFSGGDFQTVEYNIYSDPLAARLVFHSGAAIYQFAGEGEGKTYLSHADRERLWRAQTPATWALQDLYRLWHAGWDPTSPFVPILYDVNPVAFLIEGETVSHMEPAALDLDADGRLARVAAPPNAYVRVSNHPDQIIEFVIKRLTAPSVPAANHLRMIQRLAEPSAQNLSAEIGTIVERLEHEPDMDPSPRAALLDALAPRLSGLGEQSQAARWHLDMARKFLLGEARAGSWSDPYTAQHVAAIMPWYKLAYVLLNRKTLGAAAVVIMLAVGLIVLRRRWPQRSLSTPR